MEIKSVHELYPYRSVSSGGRKPVSAVESVPAKESGERDVVAISPEASFRAKLDSLSKGYAAQGKAVEASSGDRVQALKAQYQGDNCPVSGYDVARAVYASVCGMK